MSVLLIIISISIIKIVSNNELKQMLNYTEEKYNTTFTVNKAYTNKIWLLSDFNVEDERGSFIKAVDSQGIDFTIYNPYTKYGITAGDKRNNADINERVFNVDNTTDDYLSKKYHEEFLAFSLNLVQSFFPSAKIINNYDYDLEYSEKRYYKQNVSFEKYLLNNNEVLSVTIKFKERYSEDDIRSFISAIRNSSKIKFCDYYITFADNKGTYATYQYYGDDTYGFCYRTTDTTKYSEIINNTCKVLQKKYNKKFTFPTKIADIEQNKNILYRYDGYLLEINENSEINSVMSNGISFVLQDEEGTAFNVYCDLDGNYIEDDYKEY